jgi:hypothetical protein
VLSKSQSCCVHYSHDSDYFDFSAIFMVIGFLKWPELFTFSFPVPIRGSFAESYVSTCER